ncbi:WD40 repeat domain-containing protein [Streptomyces oceani]|uniref:Uncharacterized protein n=1 Tax=Streptomyces oceani TaxID=1075402 RepID=A0A1E7KLT3_9ACTN|nr:WD40 repeat domain-containing protein [Streptomyces oceani]OEV04771.1 hypothetical protein AN216_05725 [Streptomyces oceani]
MVEVGGAVLVVCADGVGDDEPIQDTNTGHDGRVLTMDTITIGDRPLAVSGSDDETVRVRGVVGGAAVGCSLLRAGVLSRWCVPRCSEGRPVVLSAGRDGWIRLWDLAALPR